MFTRGFHCEPLERRVLFVTFFVTGTAGPDTIDLVVAGGQVTATVNGTPTSMPDATVTDIVINALDGADTVTIRGNGDNPLIYDGGSENVIDNITLGSLSDGMQSILADITLTNPGGFNRMTFDDSANMTARSASIDVITIGDAFGRIMGLAPATILYKLPDTAPPVTVLGGDGNDTMNFRATSTARGTIVARGGGGNDTFILGNLNNMVDPLDASVTVQGDAGADEIRFNDQAEVDPLGFIVNATTVTRFGMAAMTYGSAVRLIINGGSDVGALYGVDSTAAGTPVTINGGPNGDNIFVHETRPTAPVTIGPSNGLHNVTINDSGVGAAAVLFEATQRIGALNVRNGGTATLTSGGGKVLTVASLDIGLAGQVNLSDNDMIVEHSGASPITSIQSYLADGYNSAAWNGAGGINSSTAASTLGTALGFTESSEIFTSFPATFSGQTVDDTAVLIKHTFYGDAILSGSVTLQDFNRLATNFGQSPRRWVHGDNNFDGNVSLPDFNRLAGNFGASGLWPLGTDGRCSGLAI